MKQHKKDLLPLAPDNKTSKGRDVVGFANMDDRECFMEMQNLRGLIRRLEKSNQELGEENHKLKRSIEYLIKTGCGDHKTLDHLEPKGWD